MNRRIHEFVQINLHHVHLVYSSIVILPVSSIQYLHSMHSCAFTASA